MLALNRTRVNVTFRVRQLDDGNVRIGSKADIGESIHLWVEIGHWRLP